MTLKSIVDIEVNAEQFDRFRAGFSSFQDKVKQNNGELAKTNKGFERLENLVELIAYNSSLAAANQDKMRKATDSSVTAMTRLARVSRTVASETLSATRNLLQWSGIAAGVAGLLAGGGMFGINRMIGGLVSRQREAGTMAGSTGIGAPGAFHTTFGQYLDTKSILSNVAGIQLSADKTPFQALGLAESQVSGATPDVAVNVISALKQFLDKHPGMTREGLESFQLGRLFSPEDIQQVRTSGRWGGLAGEYRAFKRESALSQSTAEEWARTGRQFDRSTTLIGNEFIKGLQPLAGPLHDLSKAIAEATKTIMGSGALKDGIASLSDGIKSFASYLTSPAFEAAMIDALDGIASLGRGLKKAAGWMGVGDEDTARAEARFGLGKGYFDRLKAESGLYETKSVRGRLMLGEAEVMQRIGRGNTLQSVDITESLNEAIAANATQLGIIRRRGDRAAFREMMTGALGGAGVPQAMIPGAVQRMEVNVFNATGGSAAVSVNGASVAQ